MNVVMLVKESATDILEELKSTIVDHPSLFIKIVNDLDFDSMFDINNENVDVDISDDTFLTLAKMAHEKNITFNQLVTNVLRKQMEKDTFLVNKSE